MLESRAGTLREIDEMAPKLPFRRRGEMAALYVSESVKKLRGKRYDQDVESPLVVDQSTSECERSDEGLPRPGPAKASADSIAKTAPERPDGYYDAAEPELTDSDWDFGEEQDEDAEVGREDEPDEKELPPEDDR